MSFFALEPALIGQGVAAAGRQALVDEDRATGTGRYPLRKLGADRLEGLDLLVEASGEEREDTQHGQWEGKE